MIRVPLTNRVPQGGAIGQKVSPNEGTQELQAFSQLTNTIGKAGQHIFDTQVKLKRVENKRKLSQIETEYRKRVADYQNTLKPGSDPQTWVNGLTKINDEYRAEVGGMGLPPEAQEAFDERYDDLSSGYTMKMARDATLTSVRNAAGSVMELAAQQRREGDYDGSIETIQGAGDALPQHVKDAEINKSNNGKLAGDRTAAIEIDPDGQMEDLNQGKGLYARISEQDKSTWKNQILRKKYENKKVDYTNVDRYIANGDIRQPSDVDMLRDQGEFPNLDDADIAKIKEGITRDTEITPQERASWNANVAHYRDLQEKGAPKEVLYKVYGHLERQLKGFPEGKARGNMYNTLGKIDPDNEGGGIPPDASKVALARKIGEKAIYTAMKNGLLGTFHRDTKLSNEEDPITGDKYYELTEKRYKARTADNERAELKAYKLVEELINKLKVSSDPSKALQEFLKEKLPNSNYISKSGDVVAEQAAIELSGGTSALPARDDEENVLPKASEKTKPKPAAKPAAKQDNLVVPPEPLGE